MLLRSARTCLQARQRVAANLMRTTLSISTRLYATNNNQVEEETKFEKMVKNIEMNENGIFKKPFEYGEKEFANSDFHQHQKKLNKEKNQLIDEKLELLATLNNIPLNELKASFNQRVNEKLEEASRTHKEVEQTIKEFESSLNTPFTNQDLVRDIILYYRRVPEIESSPVFEFLQAVDSEANEKVLRIVRAKEEPTEQELAEVKKFFETSNISKIDDLAFEALYKLLITEGPISTQSQQQGVEKQQFDPADFLQSLFSHFDLYTNIADSKVYQLLKEVDAPFADKLNEYRELESTEEKVYEDKAQELLTYFLDQQTPITKALKDPYSQVYNKIQSFLNEKQPISLDELFNGFEGQEDYLGSALFKTIQDIDPEFSQILKERFGH
ncbi:unnamed protein product [Ambrosiozyma monospora]|uniref:Unnamed protein product n=1 Tax=Ambrosiozyma monospora TaxID=43982 RepID=A0ACB5STS3_AMBMO|nr:unnamed protein product [Ambrosiozyma monospora]